MENGEFEKFKSNTEKLGIEKYRGKRFQDFTSQAELEEAISYFI